MAGKHDIRRELLRMGINLVRPLEGTDIHQMRTSKDYSTVSYTFSRFTLLDKFCEKLLSCIK